jgi:ABC-type transport system involved in cytochrome c biogenesis ATPase subunit
MKAIETKHLSKSYRTRVKAEGLAASFRALIKPVWREIDAVRGVSLDVAKGEVVAFIGPNGAGKSSFIKMLCGVLHPTSGELSVLGLSPVRDRGGFRCGSDVFGQKSAVLHLQGAGQLHLLAANYRSTKGRCAVWGAVGALRSRGISRDGPVRSFPPSAAHPLRGRRVVLPDPELLFLDEPTIGLDVVVKQGHPATDPHPQQGSAARQFSSRATTRPTLSSWQPRRRHRPGRRRDGYDSRKRGTIWEKTDRQCDSARRGIDPARTASRETEGAVSSRR